MTFFKLFLEYSVRFSFSYRSSYVYMLSVKSIIANKGRDFSFLSLKSRLYIVSKCLCNAANVRNLKHLHGR